MDDFIHCDKPMSATTYFVFLGIILATFLAVAYMDWQAQKQKNKIQKNTEQIIAQEKEKQKALLQRVYDLSDLSHKSTAN